MTSKNTQARTPMQAGKVKNEKKNMWENEDPVASLGRKSGGRGMGNRGGTEVRGKGYDGWRRWIGMRVL